MTPEDIAYQRRFERTGFDPDGLHGDAACTIAGHVDGCAGRSGGEHELRPDWIAFEDAQGDRIEVEVGNA